jgi:hypothetical protein
MRENLTYGSTGGSWKEGLHHGWREWAPGGNDGDERRHLPNSYRASSLPYRLLRQVGS